MKGMPCANDDVCINPIALTSCKRIFAMQKQLLRELSHLLAEQLVLFPLNKCSYRCLV
ncbi:hypothetical protein NC652_020356 [Populus alba x Populus x berolinensis]|nr:hypothetical protein NC652_020356 [Populus alba x Populus x berolinensis]